MHKNMVSAIVGVVISIPLADSAQALNARTWVSGTGVDQAGCGPIAAPCRTMQFAHDQTNAGGEIDIKDSAGYGNIVITKAINIINDGAGVAGVLANSEQDAIMIQAGSSDAISLQGLTVEGSHVGANGIEFVSGGSLTVSNSTVQGFAGSDNLHGNGILIRHSSGSPAINIFKTTILNNSYLGVNYLPGGNGGGTINVDRLTAINNKIGFAVYIGGATGTFSGSLTNSVTNNNALNGVQIIGAISFAISFDIAYSNGATDIILGAGSLVAMSQCSAGSWVHNGALVNSFKNSYISSAGGTGEVDQAPPQ